MNIFVYASALGLLAGFFYSARSLRRLLYLLFFLSLVEGVYINYFYPSRLVLVAKDILIAYIYAVFVAKGHLRGSMRRLGALLVPIAVYTAIYVVHVFNPHLNNVLVGLVGLRVAIFYIPLLLVGQVAFQNRDELWRFLKVTVVAAIPICLYGLYQDIDGGASHIFGLGGGYVRRGVAILYGTWTFRSLSTFTYAASFSTFILMTFPLAWILLRARTTSKRWRLVSAAAVLLLCAGQISSGGRQAFIFSCGLVMLTELSLGRVQLRKLILVPIAIVVGLFATFALLGEGKVNRFATIFDMKQVQYRWDTYFVGSNLTALENSPWGHGSGVASTAARHVGTVKFVNTETFVSKALYEVGIPGLLAFFWLLFALVLRMRKAGREAIDPDTSAFSRAHFALGVLVAAVSFAGWPLDQPPLNALFWAFGGIALATPDLGAAPPAPHLDTPNCGNCGDGANFLT